MRTSRLLLIAVCCLAAALLFAQSDRATALLASGEALEKAGRLDEAARNYLAARAEAERTGDRKNVAEATASLGYLRYYRALTKISRRADELLYRAKQGGRNRVVQSLS